MPGYVPALRAEPNRRQFVGILNILNYNNKTVKEEVQIHTSRLRLAEKIFYLFSGNTVRLC